MYNRLLLLSENHSIPPAQSGFSDWFKFRSLASFITAKDVSLSRGSLWSMCMLHGFCPRPGGIEQWCCLTCVAYSGQWVACRRPAG